MKRAGRAVALAALALGGPLLAGCGRTADRDEVAACASAAAGLVAPARVRTVGVGPVPPDAEGRAGVRLALAPEDAEARLSSLMCRFDGRGPSARLVELVTPAGPVDAAHLTVLVRFWLGSEEAAAAAREAEDAEPLPALPFGLAYALQQAVCALPDAAVYGLLAAAYSLVYGLSGRINFAFGEIAAAGGLAAVIGAAAARDAPAGGLLALSLGLAAWTAALHGTVAERLIGRPLRGATGQQALVASIGLAIALREYLRVASGARPHWVAPVLAEPLRLARAGDFVVTATPVSLLLAAGAAGGAAALLLFFRWSAWGREWRAAADDPLAAALMGVDPRRLALRTAALAATLVGFAGAGVTLNYGGVGFDYTTGLGLRALAAAILGGIGSVGGAFAGGLVIALTEALWSAYMPIEDRDLAVDVMLIAALVGRPGGLFGSREPAARRLP